MSDVRKGVECEYCGATFHIKYPETEHPQFCCFCGEAFDKPEDELEDEEDDGDLDYVDEDCEE